MKYSIIIAASRDEELNRCLKSLKKQHFPKENFEIIVLPQKAHPSQKRNFGVEKSTGQILCFLDDDTEVPSDWLGKISRIITQNQDVIISGPNRDKRKSSKYRLANAIQENFLTEGLHSHSPLEGNYILSDHHNMSLCHLVVPRKIYRKIGGFNEVADYFMDDVEFCYIASKLGYKLRFYPQLEIQHNIRPFFLPYFKYKFRTRYKIGKNFPLFPECYYQAKQIWLIGISYLFLLALPWLIKLSFFWQIIAALIGIYLLLILISNLKYLKKPWEYILICLGIILVHFLSWLGFTIGLITGLFQLIFNYSTTKKILIHKKLRYKILKNNEK